MCAASTPSSVRSAVWNERKRCVARHLLRRALCEACRLGAYRPAHRTSDRQRDVRAHLSVCEALIRTRSKYISRIGALARREGCRIKAGPSPSFARRVEAAALPAHTLLKKRFAAETSRFALNMNSIV